MANMTKADLIDQVAAQAGTDKKTASDVLKAFEDTVVASVKKGDKVSLTGFVSFERAARKAGTARNPQTGQSIKVAAKKVPRVAAGASFKKVVNNESPAPKLARVAKKR